MAEAAPFFYHNLTIFISNTPKQDYWAQRCYMVLFLIINSVNLLVFTNKCRNFEFHKICNIKHGTTE